MNLPNDQGNKSPAALPCSFQDAEEEETTFCSRGISSSSPSSSSSKKTAANKNPFDKPKRPLSAYNIFFVHERERILRAADNEEETPDDKSAANQVLIHKMLSRRHGQGRTEPAKKREHIKTHGKIGFVQLAKTVGTKWKGLDDASRAVYAALAAVEKARYKKELDLWNKKLVVDGDAEQEPVKIEAKKQAIHIQRVVQGSRGIFNDPQVADTTATSSSTDCPNRDFTSAATTGAAQAIPSDVTGNSNSPLRMSHTELTEKCYADLDANTCTFRSHACSPNFKAETDTLPNNVHFTAEESSYSAMIQHKEPFQVIQVADHVLRHSTHVGKKSIEAVTAMASPCTCAEPKVMHSSGADTVNKAMSNNAAALIPPAIDAPLNTDQSSVSDEDLRQFLSQTTICEDLSHHTSASDDKEMTDFLNWAFQDSEVDCLSHPTLASDDKEMTDFLNWAFEDEKS